MNTQDFWSIENKPKTDWEKQQFHRKTCHSCYKDFETDFQWAQRCPPCKAKNAPKRKRIINDKQEMPF